MKKIIALALSALFIFALLTACGKDANPTDGSSDAKKEYTVGICNYVDDASLNQIVENIQARLEEIGKEKNVTFKIEYDNCNADANLMSQIIANFQADNVDLMVGAPEMVRLKHFGAHLRRPAQTASPPFPAVSPRRKQIGSQPEFPSN